MFKFTDNQLYAYGGYKPTETLNTLKTKFRS